MILIHDPLASTSQVLESQVRTSTSRLRSAADETQGLVCARQVLCPEPCFPAPKPSSSQHPLPQLSSVLTEVPLCNTGNRN